MEKGEVTYRERFERIVDELLEKNSAALRAMVAAVRKYKASGNLCFGVMIDRDTLEIHDYSYGFNAYPVMYSRRNIIDVYFYIRTPNPFVSRRDVAERLVEALIEVL